MTTVCCCSIQGGDYENAGVASGKLKARLKRIGVSPDTIRRAMIASFEAEGVKNLEDKPASWFEANFRRSEAVVNG